MTARIGLDIGGTKTLAVVYDADSSLIRARRTFATRHGSDGVVTTAVDAVGSLVAEARLDGPWTVGVGVPGLVDPATGRVRHAVNLGVDDLDLGPVLAGALARTVTIDNDVNAAAYGATTLLPDGSRPDVAYLSIGTGLAAGLVLDGRLRRGVHGAAGEIGHLALDPDGPVCTCGQRGCLETTASGSALAAAWPSETVPAGVALFDAVAGGDPGAVLVRDRFAAAVATAVRVLCLTADVDAVVLGGGVAQLGEPLRVAVVAALHAQAVTSEFLGALCLGDRIRVVPADYPVAAIGAALLPTQEAP